MHMLPWSRGRKFTRRHQKAHSPCIALPPGASGGGAAAAAGAGSGETKAQLARQLGTRLQDSLRKSMRRSGQGVGLQGEAESSAEVRAGGHALHSDI